MTVIATRSSAPADQCVPGTFHAEAELANPVRSWLHAQRNVLAVIDEVDAGNGSADLVAGLSPNPILPIRTAVADPLQLRVLELTQQATSESKLRSWAPHGWRGLRQRAIQPLIEGGMLTVSREEDPTYRATVEASDPFTELIAVELKLRDWRRGIAQAGRYRLFAECSYLAMPYERITEAATDQARRNRIGVLGVSQDGGITVVLRAPSSSPLQPQRRRWAAEQMLAALRSPSRRSAGSPIR